MILPLQIDFPGWSVIPKIITTATKDVLTLAPRKAKEQGTLTKREGFGSVDLTVLTSLDQLLVIMQALFTFYITSYLNEETNRSEPSPSVRVPRLEIGPGREF